MIDPVEEAVARAIWEAEGGRWPIEDSGWRKDYFNKARAAIAAHLAALEAAGYEVRKTKTLSREEEGQGGLKEG